MQSYKHIIIANLWPLYFIAGLFSKIIRKIFYRNNLSKKIHKNIAVCGRGFSANKFFGEDFNSYTKIYMANYSGKDLSFKDYLKLRKKEISIISNIVEPIPNIFFLLLVNLKESIFARPANFMSHKSMRDTYRLNSLGVKVRGITKSESMDTFPLNIGNTGLLAIYEACEYASSNGIEKINLYGFDLYSTNKNKSNRLRDDFGNHHDYVAHRKVHIKLSKQMDFLISLYPKIKFINNTLNSYKFKSKNVTTIFFKS